MRGLSRVPDERYPSMEALLDELREDPQEVRRRQRAAGARKLVVIGLGVLAVVVPVGAWYGLRIRTARLCQATHGELGGVWESATKDAIRMAFLETNKSHAADTWQRVERAFDTYTAEWTHMRAETCYARWLRGTLSEEVFDLRMRCLSKRIGELGALVKVFVRADAGVLQKAVQASSSLTGIAGCADEEALRASHPQPKSAEAKAKVEVIREKLAEVEAFSKTGKYREGLEQTQKLEAEANAVDYRPVQAEVLYWLGELRHRTGEYKAAETTLYDAAHAAGRSRDGLLAAKAMAWLVWVVGYKQAQHEQGLSLGRAAEVVLGLGGGDDALRSKLLNNMGVVLWSKGGYDKALTYYRKSLAIREKALGPDHPDVASSLSNMGLVWRVQGEYDKAQKYYRKSLAIWEKALGPEHPVVAHLLNNLGVVLHSQGKYDKALEDYRKSLTIWEKALGPEHPLVASSLSNMGLVFKVQGEYDKALEYHRKALAIWEKALGPEHPDVAKSLNNMGIVWRAQGEYDKALESYRKSLAIREKVLGPEHPDVAKSLNNMGIVWRVQGKYDKALEHYRRALAIREKALGPEHPEVVESLSGIGNVLVDRRRHHDALAPLERAVRICETKTCIPDPHGRGLFALARALVATDGDNERAIELTRQAREVFGKTPNPFKQELEEVNAWLRDRGAE